MSGAEVNDGTASPEAAAGADLIDPAILAVLPDDAPQGTRRMSKLDGKTMRSGRSQRSSSMGSVSRSLWGPSWGGVARRRAVE